MPEQQIGQEIPESANAPGKHDRVVKGYLPEIAGDQKIVIDADHPMADKVSAELPEDWQKRQAVYRSPSVQAKREAENKRRGRTQSAPKEEK